MTEDELSERLGKLENKVESLIRICDRLMALEEKDNELEMKIAMLVAMELLTDSPFNRSQWKHTLIRNHLYHWFYKSAGEWSKRINSFCETWRKKVVGE